MKMPQQGFYREFGGPSKPLNGGLLAEGIRYQELDSLREFVQGLLHA